LDISVFFLRSIAPLYALIFSAIASAQTPAVLADPADLEMEREVRQLLETIETISGYPFPPLLPSIFVIPQHRLESKLCDRPCNATAAYFPHEGIYLAGHLVPLRDASARSALVHELVHFLQQGHAKFAHLVGCRREMEKEREAFEIQNFYLAHVGEQQRVPFFEGIYGCSNK
jgi:hypothetical protein